MRAPRPLAVYGCLAASFVLLGCPPSQKTGAQETDASAAGEQACARVGQTCEFAPGKLGTCVVRDGCTGAPATCFTCQSQH